MYRWTSSIPLPFNHVLFTFDQDPDYQYAFSVVVGNDIWIINNINQQGSPSASFDVLVWNTETHASFPFAIPFPNNFSGLVSSVSNYGDYIDIWATYDENHLHRDNQALHRLNIKTMELEYIITLYFGGCLYDTCTIGDTMYIIDGGACTTRESKLCVLNIAERRLEHFYDLTDFKNCSKNLVANDGICYLIVTETQGDKRYVLMINDVQQLQLVAYGHYKYEIEHEYGLGNYAGGNIINGYEHDEAPYLYLDNFDFKTNNWIRRVIEKPWKYERADEIQSIVELNDCFYVITQRTMTKYVEMNMRILEKAPKLSTICLLNAVDEKMQYNIPIEVVKMQLPHELGDPLGEMYRWRTDECTIFEKRKLLKMQWDAVIEESKELIKEGIVDFQCGKEWFRVRLDYCFIMHRF